MIKLKTVVVLLKSNLDVPVYTGQIPESQSGSAVLVQSVANSYKRELSGDKTDEFSVYRVTVVASDVNGVESVTDQLDRMDNTSNDDFQRIYTALVNSDEGLNEEPYRRAFVDLELYE